MRNRSYTCAHRPALCAVILFIGAPGAATARSLTSLAISGPAQVAESASANYTALATFNDGSTKRVTGAATWSENSSYATIKDGTLITSAVSGNQTVTVTASYRSGDVTKTASQTVTIVDSAPAAVLSSLGIQGPATVPESGSGTYTAVATFSDGSTQTVTSTAVWSENSAYASISAGVLTAAAVTGNQTVTVSASYAAGGVTKQASQSVTILDSVTVTGSHAGRFASYDGTRTCLQCHSSQAMAFHQSAHYQWKGDATESGIVGPAGKMGGINDFCIYPDINWLGKLTTTDGRQVDGGCARCHSGLGAKPTADASQAQLENIDCLFCHAPQYKRTLQLGSDGQYRFVPDTAGMSVSLLQAAADIRKPTTSTCLKCHANSGGGNNFKRGDIEAAHATAAFTFDVHMAPTSQGGAGLSCSSCHPTSGHRTAGRGIDLRERDSLTPVKCTNCHPTAPHSDTKLDKHTARVDCTVCHIPAFAKTAPTDMVRDWSLPGDLNPATGLYEPHMVMQSNVQPVYRFFNGKSKFYEFGTPAAPGANGRVLMAGPLGSIQDVGAKIFPMKYHLGKQPADPDTSRLLPLKIGVFFQTANIAGAVTQGAQAMGWPLANGYKFVETERYMGIYHGVAPKAQALACSQCHGGTRMDFKALGYAPLATRNGAPLCQSCHGLKTASFNDVHAKHTSRFDCSTCHSFSKAR